MAILNELIEEQQNGQSVGKVTIRQFKNEKIIGEKTYNDFIKLYDQEKGFYLSENNKKYGIISICMGLSTLISLSDFNFDLSDKLDPIFDLFKKVYECICKNGDYIYEAAPYFDNKNNGKKIVSFVETASKVAVTMTDMRNFLLNNKINIVKNYSLNGQKIETQEQLLEKVEELIIESIRNLNDSCMPCAEELFYTINGENVMRGDLNNKIDYKGWYYEKVDDDPNDYEISLYSTFHATNVFMNMYLYLGEIFDERYDKIMIQKAGKNPEELKMIEINKNFIENENNRKVIDDFYKKVVSAGRYLDYKIKKNNINLANFYINKNIEAVSYDEVYNSQRSNDVINTLFAIHIMLNSGVDVGYEQMSNDAIKAFREEIQFSLNNIKKIYLLLKKESKEDIVDKYNLLFDERCPKDMLIFNKERRKNCANVSPYDFIPLYCNLYANISKYLIAYPQREMTENLEMTLNNSVQDMWLWPKDGFEINNNAYYLLSLLEFYYYYYDYELPLSEYGKKYNEKAENAKKDLDAKIETLKEMQLEYDKLKKEYEEYESSLDKEVKKIAEETCQKMINSSIEKYFNEMIDDCRDLSLEIVEQKGKSASWCLGEEVLLKEHAKANILLRLSLASRYDKIIKELGDTIKNVNKNNFINKFNSRLTDTICRELD